MRARVIDLDGSLAVQPGFVAACAQAGGDLIAARALAPKLRLLAQKAALRALDRQLGPHRNGDLYFIGSGDFHHLTLKLVERVGAPVSIIHFDNHPDWIRLPASLNCGSWVARALERPDVLRIITLGPDSEDLRTPQAKGAALRPIREGRLEVHPLHGGTTAYAGSAFRAHGVSAPHGTGGRGLAWPGLSGGDWPAQIETIATRLPDAPLWVTLDKDVLSRQEAVTNWDQGSLSLSLVLEAVSIFARHRPIAGMDVCGDYSAADGLGPWRRFLAFCDRSQRRISTFTGAAINGDTNLRILRHMAQVLQ
ncbi:hypothetical protein GCM10007301_07510 [Azorhizobium oxalatiphilum]|uniref:Arginase n=1 Tax=Azorhizobium oxalatiphilum TaxID=980631 RepID=A0A917BMJ1_9HYPH|nr:hypothetical protein [Azorhizobium oxalatiphilum]GGF50635.1 hypothetical protein GCM10007301_07510 [Azorhizobium oxalatiphilum]